MTVLCPAQEAHGIGTWQLQAGTGMSPSPEVTSHAGYANNSEQKCNHVVPPHTFSPYTFPQLMPPRRSVPCPHTAVDSSAPTATQGLLPLQWVPAGGRPPQSRWDHLSTLINAALHCQWQHTQDQGPAAVSEVSPEQQ